MASAKVEIDIDLRLTKAQIPTKTAPWKSRPKSSSQISCKFFVLYFSLLPPQYVTKKHHTWKIESNTCLKDILKNSAPFHYLWWSYSLLKVDFDVSVCASTRFALLGEIQYCTWPSRVVYVGTVQSRSWYLCTGIEYIWGLKTVCLDVHQSYKISTNEA